MRAKDSQATKISLSVRFRKWNLSMIQFDRRSWLICHNFLKGQKFRFHASIGALFHFHIELGSRLGRAMLSNFELSKIRQMFHGWFKLFIHLKGMSYSINYFGPYLALLCLWHSFCYAGWPFPFSVVYVYHVFACDTK